MIKSGKRGAETPVAIPKNLLVTNQIERLKHEYRLTENNIRDTESRVSQSNSCFEFKGKNDPSKELESNVIVFDKHNSDQNLIFGIKNDSFLQPDVLGAQDPYQ